MVRLDPRCGRGDKFKEAFLDEDASLMSALMAYKRGGFAGPIRVAHPPRMEGDTVWGNKGRAFDLGNLRALMQVVERME